MDRDQLFLAGIGGAALVYMLSKTPAAPSSNVVNLLSQGLKSTPDDADASTRGANAASNVAFFRKLHDAMPVSGGVFMLPANAGIIDIGAVFNATHPIDKIIRFATEGTPNSPVYRIQDPSEPIITCDAACFFEGVTFVSGEQYFAAKRTASPVIQFNHNGAWSRTQDVTMYGIKQGIMLWDTLGVDINNLRTLQVEENSDAIICDGTEGNGSGFNKITGGVLACDANGAKAIHLSKSNDISIDAVRCLGYASQFHDTKGLYIDPSSGNRVEIVYINDGELDSFENAIHLHGAPGSLIRAIYPNRVHMDSATVALKSDGFGSTVYDMELTSCNMNLAREYSIDWFHGDGLRLLGGSYGDYAMNNLIGGIRISGGERFQFWNIKSRWNPTFGLIFLHACNHREYGSYDLSYNGQDTGLYDIATGLDKHDFGGILTTDAQRAAVRATYGLV